VRIEHHRVDGEHSNAFAAWQRMGSPRQPSIAERAALETAARLAQLPEPGAADVSGGQLQLELRLPRQAVSLLTLRW
jgi:xylan 1,4-beta-xylosidase